MILIVGYHYFSVETIARCYSNDTTGEDAINFSFFFLFVLMDNGVFIVQYHRGV